MKEMTVSQVEHGHEVLLKKFDEDGYLLFRGALDQGAISKLRSYWAKSLADCGYIERDDMSFTVKQVDAKDYRNGGYKFPLDDKGIWRVLSQTPEVNAFMRDVFGEDVFWLPLYNYRAQQPSTDTPASRFAFWHTDQHYNPGIRLFTAWVPLSEIDADMGGMALIPGVQREPTLEEPLRVVEEPEVIAYMRQDQPILSDAHAVTTTFSPGDVILFDARLPHSGLLNLTDRFRVSMDLRFQLASDVHPMMGPITAIEGNSITVRDQDGHEETVLITQETLVRENSFRLPSRDVGDYIPVGTEVLMSRANGAAQLLTHLVPTEGRLYTI